uniref:Galectin n=1 Tax=Caenorhabditis tropicalis TaxID=1561998 RepID=A0A1I7U0F6_9PELO
MYVIENPRVPSVHSIQENLKAGTEIEVNGNVHNQNEEFAIELLSGANIVLHINFRFEENHEMGFEFKTEWCKRHDIVNDAVQNAYDTVPNAPQLAQIEGTQHY